MMMMMMVMMRITTVMNGTTTTMMHDAWDGVAWRVGGEAMMMISDAMMMSQRGRGHIKKKKKIDPETPRSAVGGFKKNLAYNTGSDFPTFRLPNINIATTCIDARGYCIVSVSPSFYFKFFKR
jgi:hypothetical protein